MASSSAGSPRLRPEAGFTTSYLVQSPTKAALAGNRVELPSAAGDPFGLRLAEPACHGLLRDTKATGARSASFSSHVYTQAPRSRRGRAEVVPRLNRGCAVIVIVHRLYTRWRARWYTNAHSHTALV